MPVMEAIVGFAVGILGNYIATITQPTIPNLWQQRLSESLADQQAVEHALTMRRSMRDEIRAACRTLSRELSLLGPFGPQEREIWLLLSDRSFQDTFADWLMIGGIEEGKEARALLADHMQRALDRAGALPEEIERFKSTYFEMLDRAIFASPVLARWRHQKSLDYLREQVAAIRQAVEQAAGKFPAAERQAATLRYADLALKTWDIIDLSNLPEGDIQLATQTLLLRKLYLPLKVQVEVERGRADDASAFAQLEDKRSIRRRQAAGHLAREADTDSVPREPTAVGQRLSAAQRLVVLGDPGGGKTTLLRWMATAYLLRERDAEAYTALPDIETLPDQSWLPVLIRCRDLGNDDLCRSFRDFLSQHLLRSELLPREADIMHAVILDRMASGQVLLLVDGLDEITNPQTRVLFCKELEHTATRYPELSIIVTSRIVGYRDMPYRMGSGFEHAVITDLVREDKNRFASNWIAVTEQHLPASERERHTQELFEAFHTNDRIERLTGNPMLLTTLALVKRKVGKLPSRRNKLYAEAVGVLLNWNPQSYETIDEQEAVPQLAYLAHAMCARGVQRLTDDEVIDLLYQIRQDYPRLHALRQRDPRTFLNLIEARSSILIKSGGHWINQSREEAIWEFRHLTFQEYLAAQALLKGRYPDRDSNKKLPEVIAPLAGILKKGKGEESWEVTDSWQETLRLLVADASDDDVDDLLRAILTPLDTEDVTTTTRPRAILAARCLADEPNVSEEVAHEILANFVAQVREKDGNSRNPETSLDIAALELRRSLWTEKLKQHLFQGFFQREDDNALNCGGIWAFIEIVCAPSDDRSFTSWLTEKIKHLNSNEKEAKAEAALILSFSIFSQGKTPGMPEQLEYLLVLLTEEEPLPMAASSALWWLTDNDRVSNNLSNDIGYIWYPQQPEVDSLLIALASADRLRRWTVKYLIRILSISKNSATVEPLLELLNSLDSVIQEEVIDALGNLGETRAIQPLINLLNTLEPTEYFIYQEALTALYKLDQVAFTPFLRSSKPEMRRAAVAVFAQTQPNVDKRLLSCDVDGFNPWLDPQEAIPDGQVEKAAELLEISPDEVMERLKVLGQQLQAVW